MAEDATTKTPANGAEPTPEVRFIAQYVKDVSFENPNVLKTMSTRDATPNLTVEVNVGAQKTDRPDVFESSVILAAKAEGTGGIIYELEVTYAGLLEAKNVPQQALEPLLLIQAPSILFPFVRRIAADLTREGGYPPLFLDPIDFASLYVRRRQEAAAAAAGGMGGIAGGLKPANDKS